MATINRATLTNVRIKPSTKRAELTVAPNRCQS
jgi:hypothetical protein